MDGCNYSVEKITLHKRIDSLSWSQKEANTVIKWMASQYSSLEIKRYTDLKNGQPQVVFWKKSIVFTKILYFK